MRVLMLSWEYPPHVVGGLGRHVAGLVPGLARLGVEVHLITPLRGEGLALEHAEGVVVHRIPSPSGEFPDFYTEAWQSNRSLGKACESVIESSGRFDLIHNHDWLTSLTARALKHKYRLPMVATIHATERGRGRGDLRTEQARRIHGAEWWLTYEAWRVICCTRYMAAEVHGYFDTPEDKIDVVPNGVDPTRFKALEGVELGGFRARYASPEQKLIFHVGRIVREKGIEILVRAVPTVLASVPDAQFVIAGKGPELDKLRELVRRMDLSKEVRLLGFIDDRDRDRLYKVADCAVFPSLYEPFGIVALEAMAARTPVVVSEVGGLREVVRHAETAITIYPNDVESCAWGILHTLQHPEWARKRVENAYREVLSLYNWDRIAAQTEAVYARVVEERLRADW